MMGYIAGDGRIIAINKPVFSIGRDDSNDLTIHHSTMSQFHARIIFQGPEVAFIEDLHSRCGTFVNDYRICSSKFELRSTNILRFGVFPGRFRIVFGMSSNLSSVMGCSTVEMSSARVEGNSFRKAPVSLSPVCLEEEHAPDLGVEELVNNVDEEGHQLSDIVASEPEHLLIGLQDKSTQTEEPYIDSEKQLLRLVRGIELLDFDKIRREFGISLLVELPHQKQVNEVLQRVHLEANSVPGIERYAKAFGEVQAAIDAKCKAVMLHMTLLEQIRALASKNIALRAGKCMPSGMADGRYRTVMQLLEQLELGEHAVSWLEKK